MKQNSTIKAVVAILATTFTLAACHSNYQKTKSGMLYTITHSAGKEKIKNKQVVKFFIEYSTSTGKKDTVLQTNFGKLPGYIPVDTSRLNKYDFPELLPMLGAGDKAEFVLSIDSLKKWGALPADDKLFKKGGTIKGKLEIVKVFSVDSLARADYDAELKVASAKKEEEKKTMIVSQKKALKEYADKNHIKYIESPLGTLVEIQSEGVGLKADSGKYAKLMYKGALLSGKVFDTNMGADAKHKDPLEIAVGTVGTPQSMIQGLDDAMRYFGKGGKGRLLIPAVLAYGDRANEMIPANANLVFDIEVVDVTTEAPKATTPDMAKPMK